MKTCKTIYKISMNYKSTFIKYILIKKYAKVDNVSSMYFYGVNMHDWMLPDAA